MQTDASAETGPALSTETATALAAQLFETLTPFFLNALGALAVLIFGMWIAGRIKKVLLATLAKTDRLDKTLVGFFASLAHYVMIALVIITTLGVFGVPTTSFAALLGASGLAIGLALQGTLSHVASGVMLLGVRPFKVGDYVETAGLQGTVQAISLFTTQLSTVDNKKIIIPNSKVWDEPITNFAGFATRRLDLVFGVSYADDLDKALASIKAVIESDSRVINDPEPVVAVDELAESSVNIICRIWVVREDYAELKWHLLKAVKERLDKDGLTIPYPTRTIEHVGGTA